MGHCVSTLLVTKTGGGKGLKALTVHCFGVVPKDTNQRKSG